MRPSRRSVVSSLVLCALSLAGPTILPAAGDAPSALVRFARARLDSPARVLDRLEKLTAASGAMVARSRVVDALAALALTPGLRGLDLDRPVGIDVYVRRADLPRDLRQTMRGEPVVAAALPISSDEDFRTLLSNLGASLTRIDASTSLLPLAEDAAVAIRITEDIAYATTDLEALDAIDAKGLVGKAGDGERAWSMRIGVGDVLGEIPRSRVLQAARDGLWSDIDPKDREVAGPFVDWAAGWAADLLTGLDRLDTALEIGDSGPRVRALLRARSGSPLGQRLAGLKARASSLPGALPEDTFARLFLQVPTPPGLRREVGPRIFAEFERAMAERNERWILSHPEQAEPARREMELLREYVALVRRLIRSTDRVNAAAGLGADAAAGRIVVLVEFEGGGDTPEKLLDIFLRIYRATAEGGLHGTPEVRLETEEPHGGFRVLRSRGVRPPPIGLTAREELEVIAAAHGSRLVLVLGDDALAHAHRAIDRLAAAAGDASTSASVHLGLRVDVKPALDWAMRAIGSREPQAGMALATAALLFQKPDEELTFRAEADGRGLRLEARLPRGLYGLIGQALNVALAQLQTRGR